MSSPIIDTTISELHKVKRLAEKAIDQLDEQQVWHRIDPESNSVAVIMRHMAGNMRSRWTDFRTTDGEKPDRHRDQEFEDTPMTREALMAEWEDGWRRVFSALEEVKDDELQAIVMIRQEPHTIYQAIVRQIAHYAGHVYQILAFAKHIKGAGWHTLSVPRGKSEEFNQQMLAQRRAAK
jgi:Protein of unknown function (DUF1572)